MKKTLFFLLISFSVYSQTTLDENNIVFGTPYEVRDAMIKEYITVDDILVSVKIKKDRLHLQTYDLGSLKQRTYNLYGDFEKDFLFEELLTFNGRTYLFYTYYDRRGDSEKLCLREIDVSTGKFLNQGEILLDVKGKVAGKTIGTSRFNQKEIGDNFLFYNSLDSSRIVIAHTKYFKPKNSQDGDYIMGFDVLDKDLNFVWGEDIEMPYGREVMSVLDCAVDEKNNIYLLTSFISDRRSNRNRGGSKKRKYEVMKLEQTSDDIIRQKVDLDTDKAIYSARLFEMEKNQFTILGYYWSVDSKRREFMDVNGLFMIQLDNIQNELKTSYINIPLEIANLYSNRKAVRKNSKKEDAGLAGLTPVYFYLKSNGDIILVGEQQEIIFEVNEFNGSRVPGFTFLNKSILATCMNSEGSLLWMKKIPKNQTSSKLFNGNSFKLVEGEESINLIYIDHIENLNLEEDRAPVFHKNGLGGFLTTSTINKETGKVQKTSILDTRDIKGTEIFQFGINRVVSIKPNEFIFEVYKKDKEDILVKVDLN